MSVPRIFHTATRLLNGEVLVAGGANSNSGYLATAELYNPSTGSWTPTGTMTTARELHRAVLLPSGEVLVAGGENAYGILSTTELYNPSTGTWTATGSMNMGHSSFSLTVLQDGKVLAVQGTNAELYDPATGTWSPTSSAPSSVAGSSTALLPDGRVLAIGECTNVASALYSPSTASWSATASTGATILNPITPVLPNGRVFVTGGSDDDGTLQSTSALYEPYIGRFTLESGPCPCAGFNGALLQTGEVLVAGGFVRAPGDPGRSSETIDSAELWDSSTRSWKKTGSLNGPRAGESLTVLRNGQALVAGGSQSTKTSSGFVILATAELYRP
ncbi:MAG TPA: kelch repeat-containing protein [Terriglobia bacterium]|nr:kelch repeat-containing protein [Terriglobia bacterium]